VFKSIGIAAFGGAVGVPVLVVALVGCGLVGAGIAAGYMLGHAAGAATTGIVVASL
jgi:hypothetical protein